ncbi:GD22592 [Drosophila simulans]|uniref:GD22592 n=1 Tax=Drosophila simulans TaxID=7240 RepID=B4Q4K0_DROSI|nr:GD22592 [Drosophila simulans]
MKAQPGTASMLIRQSRRRCQCQCQNQDQDQCPDQVIQALTAPSCLLKNHRPEIEHILSILWLALQQHQCNITTSQHRNSGSGSGNN